MRWLRAPIDSSCIAMAGFSTLCHAVAAFRGVGSTDAKPTGKHPGYVMIA